MAFTQILGFLTVILGTVSLIRIQMWQNRYEKMKREHDEIRKSFLEWGSEMDEWFDSSIRQAQETQMECMEIEKQIEDMRRRYGRE